MKEKLLKAILAKFLFHVIDIDKEMFEFPFSKKRN